MSTCAHCGIPLGRRNQSGYCRKHVAILNASNPEWREKQRAGCRLAMAADPERRKAYADRARRLKDTPGLKEKRRERWMRERLWIKGNAVQPAGSEVRRKAGRNSRATRLADIPAHLRDEYVALARSTGMRAEDRKRLILEQEAAELDRFRNRFGVPA